MTSGTTTVPTLNEVRYAGENVASVGNDPMVYFRDRSKTSAVHARVPTTIPCGFALQTMNKATVLVGGAQPKIDVFEDRNLQYQLTTL